MTSLRRSSGSGDGGGGSSGSGGGHTSSSCGAVQWGVSGGDQMQLQRRPRESLSPHGLAQLQRRGASRSSARCPYVICTGDRAGQTCGTVGHTPSRCFSCLSNTWRAEFGNTAELPCWLELLGQGVDVFALDYDTILTAIYTLTIGTEGGCSLCVLPNLGIEVAALGASESALLGTAPAEALHTFTLDSGASRYFFRDSTTLTPLHAPVSVRLADSSGGPVVARSSTVLPCPAVPSGSLTGLHLPSFSTNLVSTAALQDLMVTITTPGGQRVSICTCARTGRHLATFTRRPRSSLYTLATEPPQVVASAQVFASGQEATPWSCCLLSHQNLLWHHRLGHPSLPRLRSMHSRLLVSSLPRSLPPLPPSHAPPCLPCIEGRQRAAPHSSFPPTSAPLQTLHTDVWGPTRVSGQGRERYFLLVVDDYTQYTPVFPFRIKGEVPDVLIPWIRAVRLQLRERFHQDLPILRLHSVRGVMEVARTSMIHAAAPHFLWPFAVRYAAHQLNLWPRITLPETSPTLRWTGKVGDASVFRVWGSRALLRDTSADKLSARAIPCVFLGFPPDASGWQFYHPTLRHVFPSQDVTFDESVPFYCLFLYRSTPPPPPPLFLAPGPPPVDPLPPQGPAPSGVSQVDPLPATMPFEVAGDSGAARGAASGGAEPRGAESEGVGSVGAEPDGVELGGAESERAESGGTGPRAAGAGGTGETGAGGAGVTAGASGTGGTVAAGPGGSRTRGTGAAGTGGAGGTGARDPTEHGAAGAGGAGAGGSAAGGAGAGGARAGGTGVGGARAGGAGAIDPRAGGAGDGGAGGTGVEALCGHDQRREPASRPASPVRTGRRVPRPCPPPVLGTHAMALRPSSVPLCVPLLAPPKSALPVVPDPESDHARAARPTVSRLLATNPSFESTTASAVVAELVDFAAACRLDYATTLVAESESASPPSVGDECALGTDVLEDRQEDFECLAAAAAMDAEMASWKSTGTYVNAVPLSWANIVDGMWIFRVKRPPGSPPAFKARYVARGFSQRQGVDYFQTFSPTIKMTTLWVLLHVAAQRDYELHSLDLSTAFLQSSLHEEIWLRCPPCFTGSFPAGTQWSLRRPVYGLRQVPREWHDTLRTTLAALGFAPSTADLSLFLCTDTSLPPFYVLVYVNDLVFATADTEALTLVKSELHKRHTCTDLGEMRSYLGLQITRDRARRTITLTQSHMVHQVLQRFGFQFSSPQPTPLSTGHSLSAPPSDESVERSCPYPELVGCLMYLMTCTRPDLAYPLSLQARYVAPSRHQNVHWDAAKRVLRYLYSTSGMGLVLGERGPVVLIGYADASWVNDSATQRLSQGYTFSLGSGSVSWRSTRSSLVLNSSCEAEIYARAMAAQELRWLTYLLTDLGEQPRSPPVLATRSQWLTLDAAARLAIRNHLPLAECAHFGQHRTAQALYTAVVTRYSSPATAALSRLLLPYLFPKLSAFATVEDLPPMFITLYFIVIRLPDSLRSFRDHFLSLSLTAVLLKQHLLAAETSAVAVGAARGTPRLPFFEGCSPSPLAPSYASAAAAIVSVAKDGGAASASAKRRSSKGKGGKGGGGGSSGGGGGSGSCGGGSSGGGGGGGTGGGSGGSGGGIGGSGRSGGSGGSGTGGGGTGARRVGSRGGQRQQQQRRSETQSPKQLREWFLRGASGGSCPYVIRTGDRAGQTCGRLHTQHRCFSRLDDAWRAELGDDVELPRWADLLRSRIAIFDLDFYAILSAMYALSVSADGDCYRCVPPDPGIVAAALGASESGTLPGTVPAQALHTFTLDSDASRYFFRDSTTLTPLPARVPVRLADPSGARTTALQDAMVTTTTPGGQCVSIYTCTRTGRNLATFTRRSGSSLYTLATEPPQVAASAQVSALGSVAASCSCCLLSHQTLLWHHCLGHPSLPCLRGMHSHLLVSGLPRSLPPLSPSPSPPSLPCVKGRQRAAPHSSSFPPAIAPLETLHMDVWGPARVSGQSRERYFLLVVDDCTRYTTVFPLRSKGQVVDVLIPWIRTVRLQLRERFDQDLSELRLHSDRGGEFSSNLLRYFCRGEVILQSFTLPDSPQQNGIAEHRIGLVMEVARTSMIHAAAPHFLWPFAVQYAAHKLNLWPRVSLPETSPTLRWMGKVGDASVFRGPAPSGVSQVDPPLGAVPGEVAVDSGAARVTTSGGAELGVAGPGGAEPGGAATGGGEPWGVETGGAEPEGVEPGGSASEGTESGGAEPQGAASSGGSAGASPRLSPQQLCKWFVRHARLRSGATGAGGAGARGAGVVAGAGVIGGTAATGPGGARSRGTGAAGTGGVGGAGAGNPTESGAAGAGGSGAHGTGAGGAGFGGTGAGGTGVGGTGAGFSLSMLAPSPYTEQSGNLTERREPAFCPVSPVCTAHRVPRSRPPPVPGTHAMALHPSSVPLRVLLRAPPESSLLEVPDSESDRARATSPNVSRLLATAVTDPSFGSAAASALVAELLDFAVACRLDYVSALVAESVSACPPSLGGTYVNKVPPPGANTVDGMWIFRVKRPPGSLPALKACYVDRGFSQRQGVDYFHNFSPNPKMTTLRVLLHIAAQRDYELHSLDFSIAFLQGSLHEEIWLRRPPGFTGSFPAGTQWSLRRPVYGLRQGPHEWHDTLRTTLAALGFAPSTTNPPGRTAQLSWLAARDRARRTITLTQSHMAHQVLQRLGFQFSSPQPTPLSTNHSLSAPPSDESVVPSGPYPELVGCLMYLITCTRPDLAYPLSLLARYVAPGRHQKVHWDAAKRVLRYLCSTSRMGLVLGERGLVVLTDHADAS
ncbi:unnamed protein product [Closterium sp. NIES-54]